MLERPCADRHVMLQPDICNICKGFSPMAGRPSNQPLPASSVRSCRFRGKLTGETAPKFNCLADPPRRIPLISCKIHTVCTLDEYAIETACCKTCTDRQAAPETTQVPPEPKIIRYPAIRKYHLAYYILPVADNGVWRANVDRLRARWQLFTGKKVVAIATGERVINRDNKKRKLDSFATVRDYLPNDCEVIEIPNDPKLWELAAWPKLWETVLAGADNDDAILYCHAKGVTHTDENSPVRRWVDLLYTLCLDYPNVVHQKLQCCPIAGPIRRPVCLFQGSRWYYSGNFWWVRAGEMRKRWAEHKPILHRWGAEAWVGKAFMIAESATLGPLCDREDLDGIYETKWWDTVNDELTHWFVGNRISPVAPAAVPLNPPRLSIILPTTNRPTLHMAIRSCADQLLSGDEILVKLDQSRDWGQTPRNEAMPQAKGDYLLFLDDDDVYLTGAFDVIRAALTENPGRPHIFRMRRGEYNDLIWTEKVIRVGNVSTQMFVVPNDPARLGRWGKRYEGDYDFITSTLAKYPADSVVWREEPIAIWRA